MTFLTALFSVLVDIWYKDIPRQEKSTSMFGGVGRGRVRELFAGNFPMLIFKKKQFF